MNDNTRVGCNYVLANLMIVCRGYLASKNRVLSEKHSPDSQLVQRSCLVWQNVIRHAPLSCSALLTRTRHCEHIAHCNSIFPQNPFLVPYSYSRKAPVKLRHVCPSFPHVSAGLHWRDFYEIWYWFFYEKFVWEIQIWLKSNVRHLNVSTRALLLPAT
jgi:hypothetical protein